MPLLSASHAVAGRQDRVRTDCEPVIWRGD
jgi:hypothetical protein